MAGDDVFVEEIVANFFIFFIGDKTSGFVNHIYADNSIANGSRLLPF
ncbi:hypothetical protein [Bartonella rattimassiliensis]|nr:hypothetical protein [Bartonella rattimassiliensis]